MASLNFVPVALPCNTAHKHLHAKLCIATHIVLSSRLDQVRNNITVWFGCSPVHFCIDLFQLCHSIRSPFPNCVYQLLVASFCSCRFQADYSSRVLLSCELGVVLCRRLQLFVVHRHFSQKHRPLLIRLVCLPLTLSQRCPQHHHRNAQRKLQLCCHFAISPSH